VVRRKLLKPTVVRLAIDSASADINLTEFAIANIKSTEVVFGATFFKLADITNDSYVRNARGVKVTMRKSKN
jgi:hypothetical protein